MKLLNYHLGYDESPCNYYYLSPYPLQGTVIAEFRPKYLQLSWRTSENGFSLGLSPYLMTTFTG
jgi:hypothetical protein